MVTINRHARAGFTLMEIMIAIAILAIIAVSVGPLIMQQVEKARRSRVKTDLRAIQSAIDQYDADTAQLPSTLRDLVKKPSDESVSRKWGGPYLRDKDVPKDPWGKKFIYEITEGQENPYKLLSYGSKKGRGVPESDWISVWDEK